MKEGDAMKRRNRLTVALLVLGSALVAPGARADVADFAECSVVGEECAAVSHGICAKTQCWSCDSSKAVKYACHRCVAPDDLEAAGAPNVAPARPIPTCAAAPEQKEDGGCTVRQLGTERGIAAVFLAIGLGALGVARRRSKAAP
jgi:hypothetical protein